MADEKATAPAPAPAKHYDLKIMTWNVNGIRARLRKNQLDPLLNEKFDIVLLQETKADEAQIKLPEKFKAAYPHQFYRSTSLRKGQSGTAVWSKHEPLGLLDPPACDLEGRVTTVEFPNFIVVSVYVPNSGSKHAFRVGDWHEQWTDYLKDLRRRKPTIVGGDMNVCHEDIDIWNPTKSADRIAGFLNIEREQFRSYFDLGYVDAFRALYPRRRGAWTWWNPRNPRIREADRAGWRLDYFMVSDTGFDVAHPEQGRMPHEDDTDDEEEQGAVDDYALQAAIERTAAQQTKFLPRQTSIMSFMGNFGKKVVVDAPPAEVQPEEKDEAEDAPELRAKHKFVGCHRRRFIVGSDHCPVVGFLRLAVPKKK